MRFHFFSHDALLPRLHSADKVFSFALNYPKYFPKAPGTASKSFYRQETEAQRAEGEKKGGEGGGKCEGQRTGRGVQQRMKVMWCSCTTLSADVWCEDAERVSHPVDGLGAALVL